MSNNDEGLKKMGKAPPETEEAYEGDAATASLTTQDVSESYFSTTHSSFGEPVVITEANAALFESQPPPPPPPKQTSKISSSQIKTNKVTNQTTFPKDVLWQHMTVKTNVAAVYVLCQNGQWKNPLEEANNNDSVVVCPGGGRQFRSPHYETARSYDQTEQVYMASNAKKYLEKVVLHPDLLVGENHDSTEIKSILQVLLTQSDCKQNAEEAHIRGHTNGPLVYADVQTLRQNRQRDEQLMFLNFFRAAQVMNETLFQSSLVVQRNLPQLRGYSVSAMAWTEIRGVSRKVLGTASEKYEMYWLVPFLAVVVEKTNPSDPPGSPPSTSVVKPVAADREMSGGPKLSEPMEEEPLATKKATKKPELPRSQSVPPAKRNAKRLPRSQSVNPPAKRNPPNRRASQSGPGTVGTNKAKPGSPRSRSGTRFRQNFQPSQSFRASAAYKIMLERERLQQEQ